MPRSRRSVPAPEWLTTTQAGAILGVSSRTVVRAIKEARLPARVTTGKQFRLDRADVERFAASQQYVPDVHHQDQIEEDRPLPT